MAGDIEERLHELSMRIDRLRVLYDQHFLGMEKLPPAIARRDAEKQFAGLAAMNIGNTAMRFRYLNLLRRWKMHAERWDKILREIENGTYKPHLLLKARREKQRGVAGMPAEQPARPPSGPSPPSLPGLSESELRQLHQRYLEAVRAVGDRREVRFETLVASLQRQLPALLEKNKVAAVSFEVAIRDGRVVLRAMARREEASEASPQNTAAG